ncbi:protein unc-93 homolog A-like [Diadema antillarum]|uniref:protein unc-93 homolog A-like n=1 Tax=Diadema antillarum TaxID=105358 RepID=UPI003A8911E0
MVTRSRSKEVKDFEKMANGKDEKGKGNINKWTKRRIYKNFLVLSVLVFLNFTAFSSLVTLQSSVNCKSGLGLAALSLSYTTTTFAALFLPSFAIHHLGLKWTLTLGLSTYVLFTAANFYPAWWTLLPASGLMGLSCAPLWAAMSTYVTTLAGSFAHKAGVTREATINRFWGYFLVFYHSAQIAGNLISSLVLHNKGRIELDDVTSHNLTCGANDCYRETSDPNATGYCNPPDKRLMNSLLTVCLVLGIVAIVMSICLLDSLKSSRHLKKKGTCSLFMDTLRLLKDYRMLLLIPFTVFNGARQSFMSADFVKSYVTCVFGVHWVGFVMTCYGLSLSAFSGIWGTIAKHTGRVALFCLGILSYVAIMMSLFYWTPGINDIAKIMVVAATVGVIDAIWAGQIRALFGEVFYHTQEPAFSNLQVWQSISMAAAYGYSNSFCVSTVILIVLVELAVASVCYTGLEASLRWSKASSKDAKVAYSVTKEGDIDDKENQRPGELKAMLEVESNDKPAEL